MLTVIPLGCDVPTVVPHGDPEANLTVYDTLYVEPFSTVIEEVFKVIVEVPILNGRVCEVV